MKLLGSIMAGLLAWSTASAWAQNAIAPGGTLRVVYLGGNPAQAVATPPREKSAGRPPTSRASSAAASACRSRSSSVW